MQFTGLLQWSKMEQPGSRKQSLGLLAAAVKTVQIPLRNYILGQSRTQDTIPIKAVAKATGHGVVEALVFHVFQRESLCSERNSFHLSPLSSTPAKPFCYSHVSQ